MPYPLGHWVTQRSLRAPSGKSPARPAPTPPPAGRHVLPAGGGQAPPHPPRTPLVTVSPRPRPAARARGPARASQRVPAVRASAAPSDPLGAAPVSQGPPAAAALLCPITSTRILAAVLPQLPSLHPPLCRFTVLVRTFGAVISLTAHTACSTSHTPLRHCQTSPCPQHPSLRPDFIALDHALPAIHDPMELRANTPIHQESRCLTSISALELLALFCLPFFFKSD